MRCIVRRYLHLSPFRKLFSGPVPLGSVTTEICWRDVGNIIRSASTHWCFVIGGQFTFLSTWPIAVHAFVLALRN
jgi:hypothetical protein